MSEKSGQGHIVGKCPKCGGNVIRGAKLCRCEHERREKGDDGVWREAGECDFVLWNTMGSKEKPREFTDDEIRQLLDRKTIDCKGFWSAKKQQYFDAPVALDPSDGFRPVYCFEDRKAD